MTEEKYNAIMEARREYQREYHKRWRAANPDKVKDINARFYAKHAAERKAAREADGEKGQGETK